MTPTAEVHRRAWAAMFNAYFSSAAPDQAPFTDADYYAWVDGKPRADGVRSFLSSRGIALPDGDESDSPQKETVCGLGNRKNQAFNQALTSQPLLPYPDALALLDRLDGTGLGLAVVSSSANAEAVLTAAGLRARFPVVVDGRWAMRDGLAGKPAPDTFLKAAELLHVSASEAVVVEDALSGVAAGRAGGFGLVVGVDRGAGRQALRTAGADIVVDQLTQIPVPDGAMS